MNNNNKKLIEKRQYVQGKIIVGIDPARAGPKNQDRFKNVAKTQRKYLKNKVLHNIPYLNDTCQAPD